MIATLTCETIQELLKLTKSDVSIIAKNKIYLIAETEPKELTGNRVMITVDGEITKHGQTIISRTVLSNISKTGLMTINKNTIECGSRNIKFKDNSETLVPMNIGEKFLSIESKEFDKALDIDYAITQDEKRPILKSVFMDQDNFVAIDGGRLAIRKHNVSTDDDFIDNFKITIPGELIKIYKRIKSKEDINIYVKDNFITLEVGNVQISIRQLEGQYPNYKSFLPQEHNVEVITDSEELLEVLKSYKDIKILKLEFQKDSITIKAKTEDIEVEDKISADIKGEGFEMIFNIKFLIDCLKHYKNDVIFELSGPISPMLVTNDMGKTDLVLPYRKLNN